MVSRWTRAILLIAFCLGASPALSQDEIQLSQDDRKAIRDVIRAQLDAFQEDDGERAFSYASPSIRQHFGTADKFMGMVRTGYTAVYRPREVEFLTAYASDGQTKQAVRIVGPGGQGFLGIYAMERQADDSWRIDGVILLNTGDRAI